MDLAKLLGLKTSSPSEGQGGRGGSAIQALGPLPWVTFQVEWARAAELSEVSQGAQSRACECRARGPQSVYAAFPPMRPHQGTEERTMQDPRPHLDSTGLTDDNRRESHLHSGDLTLFATSAGPLASAPGLGFQAAASVCACPEDRCLV